MSIRLACKGLTGGRGSGVVFQSLDLDVHSGRVLTLLGPNGAGKTTLLLTLAGLLPWRAGSVEIDGVPMRSGKPQKANQAGIVLVPDDRCLFNSLTVEQNINIASRRDGPNA